VVPSLQVAQTTFYITESAAFRNRVLYFRQDDWDVLCRPLVEKLTTETFVKLDEASFTCLSCGRDDLAVCQHAAEEILRQRKLGFSFVRLLPKETGVRPIVNLRRKVQERKVVIFQSQGCAFMNLL